MVKIDFYSAWPSKKEEPKDTRSWWEKTKQASIEQANKDKDKNSLVESWKQIWKALVSPIIKAWTYWQNILSTGEDILGGRYIGKEIPSMLASAEKRRQETKAQEKKAFNLFDFTDTEQAIASTTTDLASTFATGYWTAKLATKAIPKLWGLFTMPKSVLWGIGQGAVTGWASEIPYKVLSEGRIPTAWEVGTSALVWWVAWWVIGTIPKIQKYSKALQWGGMEWLQKSIVRDLPSGIKLNKIAENLSTRANRFNAVDEEKFLKLTWQKPGEFAVQRGMTKVWDEAVAEASKLYKQSMDEADDAFSKIEGTFTTKWQTDDILWDLLEGNLTKIKAQPRNPDTKRVNQLYSKYQSEGLTASEINEAKRIYAKNHKFTWDQRASDSAVNATNLQNDLRKWQQKFALENWFDNIAEINKTTQAWKSFSDSLEKKITRSGANNAVSITDWIALSGGTPENIALFLWKKALSSNFAKQIGIKTFAKQSKPAIIKANEEAILQANKIKGANRIIFSDRGNSGIQPVVKLLPPASWRQSAKVSNVHPIIAGEKWINATKEGLIGWKAGQRPPTEIDTIWDLNNAPVQNIQTPEHFGYNEPWTTPTVSWEPKPATPAKHKQLPSWKIPQLEAPKGWPVWTWPITSWKDEAIIAQSKQGLPATKKVPPSSEPVETVEPTKAIPPKTETKPVWGLKEKPYWYEAMNQSNAVNKIDADLAYEKASKWIGAEIINDIGMYNKDIKTKDITDRINAVREIKWSIAYANAKHIENRNISNSENWNNWLKIFNNKLNAPNNKKAIDIYKKPITPPTNG